MRRYLCLLILLVSGWSNAAENAAAEAKPGICTVFVSFRLTDTGALIDLGKLKPSQYKISYPVDVATLVSISGNDVRFSRITSASARVELQLFDPELQGWTSYYSDLPACKAAEAAPKN